MVKLRSLESLDLESKRVLIRVDFNVPIRDGVIADDTRIVAALPTIRYCIERKARVILMSHLGRPKGKFDPALSLALPGERLAELLDLDSIVLTDDCIGDGAKKVVGDLRDGQVAILENLRFHKEEKEADRGFATKLAELCDVYVNDAFGAAHREHASVAVVPELVEDAVVGFLMRAELHALGQLRDTPEHPFVAVLGGAKVSDKIGVIEALFERVDSLLVGGAMANTFLAAKGLDMRRSMMESDKLPLARGLIDKADRARVDLVLPVDLRFGTSIEDETAQVADASALPAESIALDIGPQTESVFESYIDSAETVFWNGPMGLFENNAFAEGSMAVARAMASSPGLSVVGGGDSVSAVNRSGVAEQIGHISTGGGASLEFLEGKTLPGIAALQRAEIQKKLRDSRS